MQEKQTKKKPWLVDVPVCMQIWIRPDLQKLTFEPIRTARPRILFLVSDGGRNDEEWEKILQNRQMLEQEIDWDCILYKLYMDKNYGLYTMGRIMWKYIFERVDRLVFFEDDTLADPSFFPFCAELLEKYKDDERVDCIMGMNFFGMYEKPTADYFFARMGFTTGSAIWKRSVELWYNIEWMKDPYPMFLAGKEKEYGKKFEKQVEQILRDGIYDNHLPGSEFFGYAAKLIYNQLTIVPKKNMVRQMGATDDATHGVAFHKLDRKTQAYYELPIYSCDFPIKHPSYVIRDKEYDNMVKKWRGSKLENFCRRIVVICKRLYYGDGKILWNKFIDRVILRKKQAET